MSAETASSTDPIVLYVRLLNEGTEVIRPTTGVVVGSDLFQVHATPNYNRAGEEWEFPPGSIVRCVSEEWSGGRVLVARQKAERAEK
jgi:hypothetical protein